MLAALLPGIRELRTPLAAGYLWLTVLWLILSPRIDRLDLPSGAISLIESDGAGQLIAIGSAVTFAALIVGILAEGTYDLLLRYVIRRALPTDPVRGFLGWRDLLRRLASAGSRLRSGPTKGGLRSLTLAATEAVREAERKLDRSASDLRDLVLLLGFVRGRSDRMLSDEERARARAELDQIATDRVRDSLRAWLVIRIIDQLDLLARRLVSEDPALFSVYDRLRSEAQFRTAITPPLFAITLSSALIWTGWAALALVALPILVTQAIRKGDQASDLLIDAMLIGKATAPAFEQLSRTTVQLTEA